MLLSHSCYNIFSSFLFFILFFHFTSQNSSRFIHSYVIFSNRSISFCPFRFQHCSSLSSVLFTRLSTFVIVPFSSCHFCYTFNILHLFSFVLFIHFFVFKLSYVCIFLSFLITFNHSYFSYYFIGFIRSFYTISYRLLYVL